MRSIARSLACSLALLGIAVIAPAAAQVRTQPRTPQRAEQSTPPGDASTATATDAPQKGTATRTAAAAGGDRTKAPPAGSASAQRLPQGPVAPPQNLGPKAPFVLTETQQKLLEQILIKWEMQSAKVKTFKCDFWSWEYDPTFGDANRNNQKVESFGYIKYKAPDRGEYAVTKLTEFNFDKGVHQPRTENLDRWMCDGKAIFEFNAKKKQVIQRKLPPELQGKAISDGPLPFVFGAKADDLKRRYWMRDVTPKDNVGKAIWLEARPKYQQDAANFERAVVILSEPDFMPVGLQITLPGGDAGRRQEAQKGGPTRQDANTAYKFEDAKVNDPFGVFDFLAPRTPLGWKHVVEEAPSETQKSPPSSQEAAGQAQRPNTPAKRK